MNIQRLPEYILRWGVILAGMLLALVLGKIAGEGRLGTAVFVGSMLVAVGITLVLRERIFLLVPLVWGLNGQIPRLDLPFQLRDLVVMWVFGSLLVFAAFKIARRRGPLDLADFLAWISVFYLFTAWIRNPVGVEALKSDRVGGRPYFDVLIGFLSYLILSRTAISSVGARHYPLGVLFTRMFDGGMAWLLALVPALIFLVQPFYTSSIFALVDGTQAVNLNRESVESSGRHGYLAFFAYPVTIFLAAKYPLRSLLNPARAWRLLLLVGALICILLSGFRSALFAAGASFLTAAVIRGGAREAVKLVMAACCALAFLALANGTLFELPRAAQRALSWMPGNWDESIKRDAQSSTEWRVVMWKHMLTTNAYIDNHWFGDGFGFKRRDFERMIWLQLYGGGDEQESFMISGGVHSGPVSAIRYVGYVGLALHLWLLCFLAVKAKRLCVAAKSGPFELLAFFVCIPVILEPFLFTLIFGAYESSAPQTLYLLGFLKMIENSLRMAESADPPLIEGREREIDTATAVLAAK